MREVRAAFDRRREELDKYFELLACIADPRAVVACPGMPHHGTDGVDVDWVKMLKATAFLILYNFVEATVRDALTSLYDKIFREKCTCSQIRVEMLSMWVDQSYRQLDRESATLGIYRKKAEELVTCALNSVVVQLDQTKLPISGNLDADKVREVCSKHGVSVKVDAAAKGGIDLSTVKGQRNALAHGHTSFTECGRQFTVNELAGIKEQAVLFLSGIVDNVVKFAEERAYITGA